MNTMNDHTIYAYLKVRQQELHREAAAYHLIKEACKSQQGFFIRVGCQICLHLSRYLLAFGKWMEDIAQKSQENTGELWKGEEPLALTRR